MKIIPIDTKIHMGCGVFDETGILYFVTPGDKSADNFIQKATEVDPSKKFTKREVMVLEIDF